MRIMVFLLFCFLFSPCYGLSVHYFHTENTSESVDSSVDFRANRANARNLLILVANWEYDKAPLQGPQNDVELVRKFFQENQQYTGKYDIPDPLLNLSVIGLHSRLEKLRSDYAGVNIEHLIFFYFGHGRAYGGNSYLIDRQLEDFSDLSRVPTASKRLVSEKLREFKARRTLQVFDMCYSGGRSAVTNLTRSDSEYLKWLSQSEGLWELNAARAVADEKPFGPDGRVYGALTWHLIDGLCDGKADGFRPAPIGQQPKRGVVTVDDLFYWIQDEIKDQVPSSPLRGSGEFMLLQYENPEREKELKKLRGIIARSREERNVELIIGAQTLLYELQKKWVLGVSLTEGLQSEINTAFRFVANNSSFGFSDGEQQKGMVKQESEVLFELQHKEQKTSLTGRLQSEINAVKKQTTDVAAEKALQQAGKGVTAYLNGNYEEALKLMSSIDNKYLRSLKDGSIRLEDEKELMSLILLRDIFEAPLTEKILSVVRDRISKIQLGGNPNNLILWSEGEEFALVGHLHLIWYPKNKKDIFDEGMPLFFKYLTAQNQKIPPWLQRYDSFPWADRNSFLKAKEGNSILFRRLNEWVSGVGDLQVGYVVSKMKDFLIKGLCEIHDEYSKSLFITSFGNVYLASNGLVDADGAYALIDYINFKGTGLSSTERYNGEGWGLFQVLQKMKSESKEMMGLKAFVEAAKKVLARRIENAQTVGKYEKKLQNGWNKRLESYIMRK